MKTILRKKIAAIHTLDSDAAKSNAAMALYRIVMQHAMVTLYEWSVERIRQSADRPTSIELPTNETRRPTDGGMSTAVAELLVTAENLGWKNISARWWERLDKGRPCLRYTDNSQSNIDQVLSSYIHRRNDGIGHGIPGNYDPEADIDLLYAMVDALNQTIPDYLVSVDKLHISGVGCSTEIKSLRVVDGNPMLYREIKQLGGGRARVSAQLLTHVLEAESFKFETEDVFGLEPSTATKGLVFTSTHTPNWNPLGLIPDKPTLEFTGRGVELSKLADWFDDEGSRACLIFGDGGVGKTTLLIEFLHRVLSGQIRVDWKPDAIFYYTAKQTQWTVDGLKYVGVPREGLSDSLRSIVSDVEGSLGREWFGLNVVSLSTKLQSFLTELGIKRENTLLVIDNAETLARSESQVDVLAEELNVVMRRVGRVLLTSRRRERIEAKQIQVESLLEDEALELLRARGKALDKKQLNAAGDAKLRQYARQLSCKPLALEVFVHAIDPGVSLDHAFNRVARLQEAELGEFLFSDAWLRLQTKVRVLLLLMTKLADVHDEVLLKLACQECGVTVREAEEALQESLGIASVTKSAGHLTIAFSDDFRRFCDNRFEGTNANPLPNSASLDRVRSRYGTYLKGVNATLPSKDAKAFRHATARAAYAAASEGRVDEALMFYEDATVADSDNAFLWDRYAYYLLRQRIYDSAIDKAKRATKLAPNEPSLWFTKGMIEARDGDVLAANRSLQRATDLGWPIHRCWLQRAYGYFHSSGKDLDQVAHCLSSAKSTCPNNAMNRDKHLKEVERLELRLTTELKRAQRGMS